MIGTVKSVVGKIGIGKMIAGGTAVGFGYSDYRNRVNEGESRGAAFAKSTAEQALWFVPGGTTIMTAKLAADMMPMMGKGIAIGGRAQASRQNAAYRSGFGGNFVETQGAYTMRQRGKQAIENSMSNTRSVLGSEARAYHRRFHT